jgi:hypothetical protein
MIAALCIGTPTFVDPSSRPGSTPGSTDVAIYAEHARRFR